MKLLIDLDSDHSASVVIKCCEIRGGLKIGLRSTLKRKNCIRWILYALIVFTQRLSVTLRSIPEQQTCRHRGSILPRKSIATLLGIVSAETERTDHKSGDPVGSATQRRGILPQSNAAPRPIPHIPLLAPADPEYEGSFQSCPRINAHS